MSNRFGQGKRKPVPGGHKARPYMAEDKSAGPGSAGFQPAKRNPAGKMPALPGKGTTTMGWGE